MLLWENIFYEKFLTLGWAYAGLSWKVFHSVPLAGAVASPVSGSPAAISSSVA